MVNASKWSDNNRRVRVRARTAMAVAIALGLAAPAAFATDTDRIAELERKLEQSLTQIAQMQAQIAELKQADAQAATATAEAAKQAVAEQATRLDSIEESVVGIEGRVGSRAVVSAFDAASLDLGGFLHQTATHIDGDDGNASAFNSTVFELLLRAQLDEQWSAFMAQAFMRSSPDPFSPAAGGSRRNPNFDTSGGTKTDTVIAWADYKHSDAFGIRFGRFITPQGIVNIEHFPAVLLDPEQPQFLRPFGSDTLFANFTSGVDLHGSKFIGDSRLSYNAYGGNFSENANDMVYGARTAYAIGSSGVTVGLNYNGGKRRPQLGGNFDTVGADLAIDRGRFLLTSEVFASSESAPAHDDRMAWYVQPAWRLTPQWTAFYRYDFLDAGLGEGDQTENVFGLTYKPRPNIHLRASYTLKDFDAGTVQPGADANVLQLSGTLSF